MQWLNCKIWKFIYSYEFISLNNSNIKLNLLNKADCKSTHIIYIIICIKCNLFYVGETEKSLETRIRQHINHIKKFIPFLKYTNKEIARHFRSGNHKLSDFKVCVFKTELFDVDTRKSNELDIINFLNLNAKRCLNKFKSITSNKLIFHFYYKFFNIS
jgi:hypothetical protein